MSEHVRIAFERARTRVQELQRSGAPAASIAEDHAKDADLIVANVFEDALARSGREPAGIALIALGGYGRGELAPNSDLDLLLLYRGWSPTDVTALNRAVMYPLWDSKRELGDRIRDPKDVLRTLAHIDEVCALLDARLLSGDRGLFTDMQSSVWRRIERSRASFFADLMKASSDRHARYGHAGHLLEPNIRDSAGGLRDVHTVGWASKVLPGSRGDIDSLVDAGFMSRIDANLVTSAHEFLLRVRIELHLATGRHQDQLYLSEQDDIAERLGYPARDGRPPADRLMQELYFHAREVDAVVASFWDRVIHLKPRRRFRGSSRESRPAADGCVVKDGRIEVVATTNVAENPAGWMRVFRQSALRGVPVGRHSINRLHEELEAAPKPLPWSAETRDVFLDVLESGESVARVLDEMVMGGLLPCLIPEWEPIRAFPQRDLYHRFTVDRHLAAAVEELARSRALEDPDVRDAWTSVGDPDALFVAALLHDIGKGRGGDHSDVGAELAAGVAARMSLTDAQADDVVFLVADHLVLAETATRRDLNDPRTTEETAARVGDVRRLAMLYLLTRADSLATGPEAWSSFRSSLVRELYVRTRDLLDGTPMHAAAGAERLSLLSGALGLSHDDALRLIGPMPESWVLSTDPDAARRQLALLEKPLGGDDVRTGVHTADEADELILVAHDRPGLFSVVAGVLALRGFDIHDAEIYTRSDGVAVEVFRVIAHHGSISDDRWSKIRSDIAAAIGGSLDLDSELTKKATQTRRRRERRRDGAARVVVDNDASETNTVVEVHTRDSLGLLRLITKTLAEAGCDLSVAKVATYGVQVVDVFYVRDLSGRKITDPAHIARIEQSLVGALTAD